MRFLSWDAHTIAGLCKLSIRFVVKSVDILSNQYSSTIYSNWILHTRINAVNAPQVFLENSDYIGTDNTNSRNYGIQSDNFDSILAER